MSTYRSKIINRLSTLDDIEGVTVDISDDKKSLTVRYKSQRSLDFYFKWIDKSHFVGYFEDENEKLSHAVISLWEPMDAINFSSAYLLMIQLRAKRPDPR